MHLIARDQTFMRRCMKRSETCVGGATATAVDCHVADEAANESRFELMSGGKTANAVGRQLSRLRNGIRVEG